VSVSSHPDIAFLWFPPTLTFTASRDYGILERRANPPRPFPAAGASFLQIDQPGIVLIDWKTAEDGRGTILRLREMVGHDAMASVTVPKTPLKSANLCNALEDDQQPLQVSGRSIRLKFRAHENLTVRHSSPPSSRSRQVWDLEGNLGCVGVADLAGLVRNLPM
jgi:alpha-mannosidase